MDRHARSTTHADTDNDDDSDGIDIDCSPPTPPDPQRQRAAYSGESWTPPNIHSPIGPAKRLPSVIVQPGLISWREPPGSRNLKPRREPSPKRSRR